MTLLTVKEFAAMVRLHPTTVYDRIREDRQRGVVRLGRDIRIDVEIALQITRIAPVSRAPALGRIFAQT